jgi:2-keto-4-pentenoate hydratase/2-oxohepta-3-ene-1,7-dioic acid hydratase in catechol pathway
VIGKWIPLTSVKDKKNINFSFKKNGEVVQQANSKEMLFDFDYLVSYISNFFSINIGDLVFTGTPKGVGEIVVGDEVEAFMENEPLLTLDVK